MIVPIRNERDHIRETVRVALDQEFDGSIELLLVDGDSDDGTTELLREFEREDARCRVLHNPARLTPQALNIGLREARGRFVVRMDAHTLYPPEYVRRGVERLERGDVAWVAGPQLPEGHDPGSRRVARALNTWLGVGGATFRTEVGQEIETDTAFTGIMTRDTLERLGGWDEEWTIDQDTELAARVREDGGRIVCVPEMAAAYVPRNSFRGLARQYRRYGQYRVKTAVRHPHSVRISQLLPPGLTLAALLAFIGPTRSLRRAGRAGLAVYALAVVETSIRTEREAPSEAALLPSVFATMHFSYGFGVLVGVAEHGFPLAGVIQAIRSKLS